MSQQRKILKIVGIIAIVIGLIWFSRSYLNISPTEIKEWILSFGMWAPILYIVLYTVRPLIFFPASVLSITGGLAFGAMMGTVYTVIGATLGAVVAFLVAKKLGKGVIKNSAGKVDQIQQQLEKNGFIYVLIFRLLPIFNFDLISYAAGLSKVRLLPFFLATLIGIIPGTFAYNFLGSSIVSKDPRIIIGAIIVFLILTIVPWYLQKRWKAKKNLG
ncbi:TVP38/TMEM64 family protein [Exiguobacterium oxidotolerans]|uniref:TVP38/TMEM64 family membrane protein n=1 Tax=Exiguobacterium oxidotolerans TaxID=223958 RepID=A0A653I944_9BACL|nr:TVP38/TMEM64 family protein [Exiguobacterium oxidotolerans]VWX35366.1 TVP38/TMEM64 family membrane protein YtxB [Exiguobacterium oxidotolerans]